MLNMLTDIDGNTSSRIVSLFVIIIFDLIVVAYATITQKDIPTNASTILMTITMSCIPVALATQTYQNTKYKEFSNMKVTGGQKPHREDKKDNKAPDNQVIFNDRKEEEEEKNEDRIY